MSLTIPETAVFRGLPLLSNDLTAVLPSCTDDLLPCISPICASATISSMDGNANGWGAAPSFTPAPGFVADTGFTSDAGFSADTGFTPDASAGFTTGDFNPENVSKHANDDVPPDGGCRA